MRSRIVSVFSEALASAKLPVLDVAARYQDLGEALLPLINPAVSAKYGLEIPSFIVENISLPPEVEQAIDKRSSMAAVGNLNEYVKFQMAEGMAKGEGGTAASAAQLGAGLAMGQQMMAAMNAPYPPARHPRRSRRPASNCSARPRWPRRWESAKPMCWRPWKKASLRERRSVPPGESLAPRWTNSSETKANSRGTFLQSVNQ
jgi:membrane protease subunit (stomatin/prohibitin family)